MVNASEARDLVVVGGGIVGLSVALFAAREGLSVVLLDPRQLGSASTARSGALIRTHYRTATEARLAWEGLQLFERFSDTIGGDCGFVQSGFAYVPKPTEIADGGFLARMEMLQEVGIETRILDPDELRAIDPAIHLADSEVVAYEPRSGYADPALTTASLAAAARSDGVDLRMGLRAESLVVDDDGVSGVATRFGAIEAGAVCVCAGVRSVELCGAAGIELPVKPTLISLVAVPRRVETHLMVIDAAGGIYFRPEDPFKTLVGISAFEDTPLDRPDDEPPPPDAAFAAEALSALARRLPSSRGAEPVGGRSGQLDMSPDGRPFFGPTPVAGLWLSCGWSGTGFKTGISSGRDLASWIASGEPPDPSLESFGIGSRDTSKTILRSPH